MAWLYTYWLRPLKCTSIHFGNPYRTLSDSRNLLTQKVLEVFRRVEKNGTAVAMPTMEIKVY
jgi:hypothetical protein